MNPLATLNQKFKEKDIFWLTKPCVHIVLCSGPIEYQNRKFVMYRYLLLEPHAADVKAMFTHVLGCCFSIPSKACHFYFANTFTDLLLFFT
jgi:hypothetical protein